MSKIEYLELLEWLQEKITKLTLLDSFEYMKPKYRKKCYSIINIAIEVKYELVVNEGVETTKEFTGVMDLINEFYSELYGKNDLVRRSIYDKKILERKWNNLL